jgi:hypothetical protein
MHTERGHVNWVLAETVLEALKPTELCHVTVVEGILQDVVRLSSSLFAWSPAWLA